MRASSLPAMLSCVTSTARRPSSSASATPIGPPIGSNTTIVPSAGQRGGPGADVGDVEHGAPSARPRRHAVPAIATGALHDDLAPALPGVRGLARSTPSVTATPSRRVLAIEPLDERSVRAGDRGRHRRAARRPLDDRHVVAADRRDPGRLEAGRAAADHHDATAAWRPACTSRDPRSRDQLDGSPMHVTIGLRASRTWHVWLHRVHGRIAIGVVAARSFATRSGSAIWARVISTPSHSGAVVVAAERPLGLADVDDRTLEDHRDVDRRRGTARHTSMLNPVGSWKSGRVFSAEKIEPRVDDEVVDARARRGRLAMSGAISGVMPAHGASSSHDSRSPTIRSAPAPARTAAITRRANRRRS